MSFLKDHITWLKIPGADELSSLFLLIFSVVLHQIFGLHCIFFLSHQHFVFLIPMMSVVAWVQGYVNKWTDRALLLSYKRLKNMLNLWKKNVSSPRWYTNLTWWCEIMIFRNEIAHSDLITSCYLSQFSYFIDKSISCRACWTFANSDDSYGTWITNQARCCHKLNAMTSF